MEYWIALYLTLTFIIKAFSDKNNILFQTWFWVDYYIRWNVQGKQLFWGIYILKSISYFYHCTYFITCTAHCLQVTTHAMPWSAQQNTAVQQQHVDFVGPHPCVVPNCHRGIPERSLLCVIPGCSSGRGVMLSSMKCCCFSGYSVSR